MMTSAVDVNHLYRELAWNISARAVEGVSRNGAVMTVPYPVMFELRDPTARVLTCPVRDANPFFHVAETVWMLAGSDDVGFLTKFNKRYAEYAESDGRVHGAYGHRWHHHFAKDQIWAVVKVLRADPDTRQAVICMWDPVTDLTPRPLKDRPCNTQLMFRRVGGALDMLVVNRSNDFFWGALGANIVHMTYLHELVAASSGMALGTYRVVTNNLHYYLDMPRCNEIMQAALLHRGDGQCRVPILMPENGEKYGDLHRECAYIVDEVLAEKGKAIPYSLEDPLRTNWISTVALPMINAYLAGPGYERRRHIMKVADPAWGKAAMNWCARREAAA